MLGSSFSFTFPAAAELDRDLLVHVLPQVEDVLLFGPLLVVCAARAGSPAVSSPSPAAAPAPVAAASGAITAAPMGGFVGHTYEFGVCAFLSSLSLAHRFARGVKGVERVSVGRGSGSCELCGSSFKLDCTSFDGGGSDGEVWKIVA